MHGLSTIEAMNDDEIWKRYKLSNLEEYEFDQVMTYSCHLSSPEVKAAYTVTVDGWFNRVTDKHWFMCNAGNLWYALILKWPNDALEEDVILYRLGDNTYRSIGCYIGDTEYDPKGDMLRGRITKSPVVSAIVQYLVKMGPPVYKDNVYVREINRYWVFYFDGCQPDGGIKDFAGCAQTIEEAQALVEKWDNDRDFGVYVFDASEQKIVSKVDWLKTTFSEEKVWESVEEKV